MQTQTRSDRRRSMRERLATLTGRASVAAPTDAEIQRLNGELATLLQTNATYRNALQAIANTDPGKGSRKTQTIANAALGSEAE